MSIVAPDFEYAQRKVRFYKSDIEQWLVDHKESEQCVHLESVIRDMNQFVEWMFQTDIVLNTAYCDGKLEYDPKLHALQARVFQGWHEAATYLEGQASGFESSSYVVDGVGELRKSIRAVHALLHPSDGVNEEAEAEALADHRRGETEAWAVDD